MRILSLFTATVLCAFMVSADPEQGRKSQDPCAGAQTTPEMRECAGNEYRREDAELNGAYKQLMTKLEDEGQKAVLKAAQQAWLRYRDANCEYEAYLNRGGTIYSVVYTGCLTRMTAGRTAELRELLKEN